MKTRALSLALVAILAASMTLLFPGVALADRVDLTFTAQLRPSNEVPPVTNADSSASGTATVTLTITTDATGTINAATARFDVSVSGFPATTTMLILAHVHQAAAGATGPVLIDSGLSPMSPITLTGGAATFTRTGLTVSPATAQGIINNPAGFYFNVHTPLNPGGAIRGQLTATTNSMAPVVEGARIQGKNLIVTGAGFLKHAVIIVNGADVHTKSVEGAISTMLVAKKLGKQIVVGQTVTIQVRNPDGALSNTIMFTRTS
jgi:hypothetical protein